MVGDVCREKKMGREIRAITQSAAHALGLESYAATVVTVFSLMSVYITFSPTLPIHFFILYVHADFNKVGYRAEMISRLINQEKSY